MDVQELVTAIKNGTDKLKIGDTVVYQGGIDPFTITSIDYSTGDVGVKPWCGKDEKTVKAKYLEQYYGIAFAC